MGERRRFTARDKAALLLVFLSVAPISLVLFGGLGRGYPAVVALVTGLGMIAAGYSLAWGTESLQFVVSQVLALAALAVVQVLPEYSIEAVLSYHGALNPQVLQYATATMTGANRLLLGLGWPSVVFLSYFMAKRKGLEAKPFVKLDAHQSVEVFFLLVSTLYSFVILVTRSLSVFDAAALVLIYASYLYVAHRLPPVDEERAEELEGPARGISGLTRGRKRLMILGLIALGGFIILVAADPFVESILAIGASLNANEYLFVQWVAPFLTELPEGLTAVYWAMKVRLAPMAMANLVSSKVNQWTLLLSTIPVVYTVTLGHIQPIALTGLQEEEIFLTAAQSVYGVVCLLDLKFDAREAAVLLGLFLVQFFVPPLRIETATAYLVLAAFELAATYRRAELFSTFRAVLREAKK